MFVVDTYTPTRVVFGPGRLNDLATMELPGKKALMCVMGDGLMEKLGIQSRVLDVNSREAVEVISKWLPVVSEDGSNLEARTWMAYAADILGGYTQAIVNTTSHHIIAQTIGGMFPSVTHGLSLLFIAEAYYKKVKALRPQLLDDLGTFMGIPADPADPGQGFVTALTDLMERTGMRHLPMSEYGIKPEDFQRITDLTVDNTGIDWEKYTLTKEDIMDILKESYC